MNITDAMVMRAVRRHAKVYGVPMKYAEIVGAVAGVVGCADGEQSCRKLYRDIGPITQRLKASGKLVLIKGPGAGWKLP